MRVYPDSTLKFLVGRFMDGPPNHFEWLQETGDDRPLWGQSKETAFIFHSLAGAIRATEIFKESLIIVYVETPRKENEEWSSSQLPN